MKMLSMSAVVLLSGCVTASNLQSRPPFAVDLSNRTIEVLAGCIEQKLNETRGYEVKRLNTAAGVTFTLSFRIAGVPASAGRIDITDFGNQRKLAFYAYGKKNGGPRSALTAAQACV